MLKPVFIESGTHGDHASVVAVAPAIADTDDIDDEDDIDDMDDDMDVDDDWGFVVGVVGEFNPGLVGVVGGLNADHWAVGLPVPLPQACTDAVGVSAMIR